MADANPYRFSSEYYDKETEFISYFYRTYRSDIGRFISRDPIGEKGGLNLYAYVGNSPAYTDPISDTGGEQGLSVVGYILILPMKNKH